MSFCCLKHIRIYRFFTDASAVQRALTCFLKDVCGISCHNMPKLLTVQNRFSKVRFAFASFNPQLDKIATIIESLMS